jgi:hypothetical protein
MKLDIQVCFATHAENLIAIHLHFVLRAAGSGSLCFEITPLRWVCQDKNADICGKLEDF